MKPSKQARKMAEDLGLTDVDAYIMELKAKLKMTKKKRMADGLLKSLKEAVQMEEGLLKGKKTYRRISKPDSK